ncbi:MAG: hypothetical protein HRU28_15500 [Rhizobiales bacterium]|nr:hypothetical protein [Hyphomicrobiales bacterium]
MINYNPHIPTHAYLVDDAFKFGVESAAVLFHIKYILQRNENSEQHLFDGLYWYRIEKDELLLQFPYFKNRQKIERLLANLVKKDVLLCENHNKNKSDQTKWYALQTAINLNAQNRALQCPDVGIGNDENQREQNTNNSPTTAETLNARNQALQCPEVSIPMPTSGHSLLYIYTINRLDYTREMRSRLENGFFNFLESYNKLANEYKNIRIGDVKKHIHEPDQLNSILKKYDEKTIANVFDKIKSSDWLHGEKIGSKGCPFYLNLTWLITDINFSKILAGENDTYKKHKKANKFEVTKSQFEDITDWDAEYKTQQAKFVKTAKSRIAHTESYIKNSHVAELIIAKGFETKLRVICFAKLFSTSKTYSEHEISKFIYPEFPTLFSKNTNSKKAVVNA